MSDQSAIRLLQTAIENVRDNCDGPEYKDLLAACNACDQECEKSSKEDTGEPQSLKEATDRARKEFAAKRSGK